MPGLPFEVNVKNFMTDGFIFMDDVFLFFFFAQAGLHGLGSCALITEIQCC